MSANPPYLRIYPPAHCFGHPTLWLWQACSLNDVEMSGTSDDRQDALDTACNALDDIMEASK